MEESFPDLNPGRYHILSRIGAGGMGEVHLAQDTTLDRRVALKILSEEFSLDTERMRRFVQEAKAASALNHPNIITIYEIGKTGNRPFIAAEYIDGETLHAHLHRGPMSLNAVLDAAIQIASALHAAHDAKIIHRDIKPENVMIRPDGLVKLLDFGIAKIIEPIPTWNHEAEIATTLRGGTSPGMIIGTAAYMSPEQARGKTIDGRTDIFSLGVLLYEMLTGRKPFDGETPMDIIGAILNKEPEPIRDLLDDVPPDIERIVNKLLRKDRDERYQTIKDVLIDLKDVRKEMEFQDKFKLTPGRTKSIKTQTAATSQAKAQTTSSAEYIVREIGKRKAGLAIGFAVLLVAAAAVFYWTNNRRPANTTNEEPIDSIAVLPFQNKRDDAETEYLSEGLAESLIFGLSQLPNLKVSPSSLVFRYKNKEIDPMKIGSELGVSAVMTGRFDQHGDNLTLSVELVDVRNNKLLWGKHYDHKMADLMTTQRDIATEITQNLRLKLSGDEQRMKYYTRDPEAYQLYLKGHYYASRYTKDGFNKGIDYFEQAITKDPNFARAYSGLAFCYLNQIDWVFAPKESLPKVRQAVESALKLDETLAEAHTMQAMLLLQYDWNWAAAEREFRRAIEIDPNYALGRSFLAWYLAAMGRFDESIAEDKRALDLDPLSAAVNADLGWDLYMARRFDEAIEQLRKGIDLEPNYWVSHVLLGRCYEQQGKLREAVEEFEKAREIESSIPEVMAALGHGYAMSGRRTEALQIIHELQERSKKDFVPSFSIATVYLGLGMKEEAIQHIVKSYQEGSYYMIYLKVDPLLDSIRADPRFIDVMRRVGHPV
ncbi:MAG TPA: protein kinase [Pyrinomonadaceae bacterium]|jgi:serine/threonine protein kinase/Tfp pilus assembly protein PilF|nr:protein kinase [Pyrinomonadaceae bacterium]